MAGKLKLLIGFGAGYVLGARAGRERYEQIKSRLAEVRSNPKVQSTASHVRDVAAEKADELKETVTEKVNEKVHGGNDAGDAPSPGAASTDGASTGAPSAGGATPGGTDGVTGLMTAPVSPDAPR